MMTPTPEENPRPVDEGDAADKEIAAFAALVRSSSAEAEKDDDGNGSLVSRHDEGERSGLLGHGDEQRADDDASSEGEGCDGSSLRSRSFGSSGGAPSSFEIEDGAGRVSPAPYDDDDELYDEQDKGYCRFLLAKIKAQPSLSVATLFMGMLTVTLWTDQRFRFVMRGNHASSGNGGDGVNSIIPLDHSVKLEKNHEAAPSPKSYPAFPAKTLLGITVRKKPSPVAIEPPYDPMEDFQYEKFGRKRTLLYWEEVVEAIEQTHELRNDSPVPSNESLVEVWTNISTWGPCYPRALPQRHDGHRQRSLRSHAKMSREERIVPPSNWTYIVRSNSDRITDENSIVYPNYKKTYHSSGSFLSSSQESLGGMCRPGFLIIGQGKCGTSSLYHYLTGHPRILPAKEKQIHYFRYHRSKPLEWYYSHFPTIESFLGRGALMTGEASPGYMPYPTVVEAVAKKLTPDWTPRPGEEGVQAWREHVRSLPKIIAIVRDPISRAVSSYKYNYIEPAMKKLRSGRAVSASGQPIPGNKRESYYRKHHLFSFEDLAYAELAMLKECLKPGGRGERWSHSKFGKHPDMFFYDSVQRRSNGEGNSTSAVGSPPLIHLDEACYVATSSKVVPRVQWKDLAVQHPSKILQLPNLQLTQSIIGRGVYALPLGWWYEVFSNAAANQENHIHVVCTEDMAEKPAKVMDDVTKFLGLPEFDFEDVTSMGRYNVGGHRGYDKITKAHDDEEDSDDPKTDSKDDEGSTMSSHAKNDLDLLAISDALRNELLHFYRPYNERLFKLIGKQCPWK